MKQYNDFFLLIDSLLFCEINLFGT